MPPASNHHNRLTSTLAQGTAEAKALKGTGEGKRLKAIGEEAIKQIKIVELISSAIEKGAIKIVPEVLVTGNGSAGDALMGQLARLLPSLDLKGIMRTAMPEAPAPGGESAPPMKIAD